MITYDAKPAVIGVHRNHTLHTAVLNLEYNRDRLPYQRCPNVGELDGVLHRSLDNT